MISRSISKASRWINRVLFNPFEFKTWFGLGFCAFLANLNGGCTTQFNVGDTNLNQVVSGGGNNDWAIWSLIGIGGIVLVFALLALFEWLSSRGIFMFLDGVIHERGDVTDPWSEFSEESNSLFKFRMMLHIFFFGFLLIIGGLIFYLEKAGIVNVEQLVESWNPALMLPLLFIFLSALFVYLMLLIPLSDFVVPIMYKRRCGCFAATGIFFRDLLPGNTLSFTGFYLVKMLLWIPAILYMIITLLLTCCTAALPYLNAVFFLPVYVFFRCYSLAFLEELDERWKLLYPEDADVLKDGSVADLF